jgi:RNA polymerase sigma factor (sigma-70 family)
MCCNLLEFLEAHGPRLYAMLTRLTMSQHVAEDLLQDLFLRLEGCTHFGTALDPEAYAYRVAVNLALDWRRCRKTTLSLDTLEKPAALPSPLDCLTRKEEIERILNAAAQLSETLREVFILRYVEQHPYEMIAERLNRTTHQVRALCAKAIAEIRSTFTCSELPECRRG